MRILFLICLLLFSYNNVKSQDLYFTGGYGGMISNFSELNKMVYLHNINNDVSDKMGKFNFAHGINFGAGFMDDALAVELMWHNYHTSEQSELTIANEKKIQQLKLRWNTATLNFIYVQNRIRLGAGINLGSLAFKGRIYSPNAKKGKYSLLSDRSYLLRSSSGFNGFVEFPFAGLLRMRLTYNWSLGGTSSGTTYKWLNTGVGSSFAPPEIKIRALTVDLFFLIQKD